MQNKHDTNNAAKTCWQDDIPRADRTLESETWALLAEIGSLWETAKPCLPDKPMVYKVVDAFSLSPVLDADEMVADLEREHDAGKTAYLSNGMAIAAVAYCVLALRAETEGRSSQARTFLVDGWRALSVSMQLHIAYSGEPSALAVRGANARHKENRAMKAEAIAHYQQNAKKYRSKDAAAEAIAGSIVPVTFRTVRDWLANIRPAGKP